MMTDFEAALLNRLYMSQLSAINADRAATQARIARKRGEIARLRREIAQMEKARLALACRAW